MPKPEIPFKYRYEYKTEKRCWNCELEWARHPYSRCDDCPIIKTDFENGDMMVITLVDLKNWVAKKNVRRD